MRLRIRTVCPPGVMPKGQNLRVENAETNELVDGVEFVEIRCEGRTKPVTVVMRIRDLELDIEAEQHGG